MRTWILSVIGFCALLPAVAGQTPLAPPLPAGSTYYKGKIVSQQGVGVIGCTNAQFILADGSGCASASGSGGVSEIIPGTNITCTPDVLGNCIGNVTVNTTGQVNLGATQTGSGSTGTATFPGAVAASYMVLNGQGPEYLAGTTGLWFNGTITDNGVTPFLDHSIQSAQTLNAASSVGDAFATIDAIETMNGGGFTWNHYHSFQSRPAWEGNGTISEIVGLTFNPSVGVSNPGTGGPGLVAGLEMTDALGTGPISAQAAVYVPYTLTRGASNYVIYGGGTTPSFFGGKVQLNTAPTITASGWTTYGSIISHDTTGNLLDNPNLTIVNGVLTMSSTGAARVLGTAHSLDLATNTEPFYYVTISPAALASPYSSSTVATFSNASAILTVPTTAPTLSASIITAAGISAVSGTPTGTAAQTGGTMTAHANYIKVVAIDGAGNHTLPSTESASVPTVTCTGSLCSVVWAWTASAGAQSYQIWCPTTNVSGAENYYYTSVVPSYTQTKDCGTSGTGGTIPSAATTTGRISNTSTLAPTASSCGGGTAAGNDNVFQVSGITPGVTACTVTFTSALQQGYCTANGAVGLVTVPTGTSKTAVTFGVIVTETTITAHCF